MCHRNVQYKHSIITHKSSHDSEGMNAQNSNMQAFKSDMLHHVHKQAKRCTKPGHICTKKQQRFDRGELIKTDHRQISYD